MRKTVFIISAIAILGIIAFITIQLLKSDTIETAIDQFEDGDYDDAIEILNHISKTASYDAGEKIYYYRCRAANRLAEQLENRYSDELKDVALEKRGTEDFNETKRKLEKKLKKINRELQSDLALVLAMKKSRIIARGKFFDAFTARYRGSSYIEDLNFDEVIKVGKTEPEKQVQAIINFYNRYPRTNYLSQMVKILFDSMQKGETKLSENSEVLFNMIISYVQRYPTSPVMNKLYTCTGDNVNLRNSPGIEGKLMGKIKKDEILIQLEKSMDTSQIGDIRDYWYRIASLGGLKGWIFGKFLKPIDISKYKVEEIAETWAVEENFDSWEDSHTPVNWIHIPGADRESINFLAREKIKIMSLDSAKGKTSGLYMRYNASRAFSITARARYTGGDGLTLFAYVPGTGKSFTVILKEEELLVSGRKIPIHTSDWHNYYLTSDDGNYARLLVDGEVISGRIEPVTTKAFPLRGIYCFYSSEAESSKGELEYLKVR